MLVGLGAIVGVLVGGRLTDHLIRRGVLTARPVVATAIASERSTREPGADDPLT